MTTCSTTSREQPSGTTRSIIQPCWSSSGWPRSLDAAKRVLRKLTTKSDIAKPSQFISIAAKNAIDKLDRDSAA